MRPGGGDGIVGGEIVVFTVGQAQGNSIAEEHADAGAIQLAFTFNIAPAVRIILFTEGFQLHSALALGQGLQGSRGDQGANGNT